MAVIESEIAEMQRPMFKWNCVTCGQVGAFKIKCPKCGMVPIFTNYHADESGVNLGEQNEEGAKE